MRTPLSQIALMMVLGVVLTGCGQGADGHDQGAEDFAYVTDEPPMPLGHGAETDLPTDSPTVTAMDDDRFWRIIEQSGGSTGDRVEDQTDSLTTTLAGLPAQEIAAFDVAFSAHRDELYSWDLWGAAYLLMGGCSDDCFTDFRSWVVAQGQEYFEAVRADPQALADGRLKDLGQVVEAELLSYAAMDAYVEATGREMYMDYPSPSGAETAMEPTGQEWDEDDEEALRERYPRLSPLPH